MSDAYEQWRENDAVGTDDLVFEDVLDYAYEPDEYDDDLDIDEEIAKAKRVVERALFGGSQSFVTLRRGV